MTRKHESRLYWIRNTLYNYSFLIQILCTPRKLPKVTGHVPITFLIILMGWPSWFSHSNTMACTLILIAFFNNDIVCQSLEYDASWNQKLVKKKYKPLHKFYFFFWYYLKLCKHFFSFLLPSLLYFPVLYSLEQKLLGCRESMAWCTYYANPVGRYVLLSTHSEKINEIWCTQTFPFPTIFLYTCFFK